MEERKAKIAARRNVGDDKKSKAAVEAGADFNAPGATVAGPYVLEEWVPKSHLVLARTTPLLAVERELQLNRPVVEAVLVGSDLYASDDRVVYLLDLESTPLRRHSVHPDGATRGRLHDFRYDAVMFFV